MLVWYLLLTCYPYQSLLLVKSRKLDKEEQRKKSVAFFLVEDARPKMIDGHVEMPHITNKAYYRTNCWENLSFNTSKIIVGSPPADNGIINDGSGGDVTKDETVSTKEDEQEDDESIICHQSTTQTCHSYGKLVKVVIAIVYIASHMGYPTDILLTRCVGVSISRLVKIYIL